MGDRDRGALAATSTSANANATGREALEAAGPTPADTGAAPPTVSPADAAGSRGEEAERGVATLRRWVGECPPGGLVFFGGAGVSTESGIPDFRSAGGVFSQGRERSPEEMVSRSFFDAHPRAFFDFYFDHMVHPAARPNAAHRALAELERQGTCAAVVTQNIDGLHQAAGSRNVMELHGSVHRNRCVGCGRAYDLDEMLALRAASPDGVPRCSCGGVVKPDVVLYEEPLDGAVLEAAAMAVAQARLLVVAGTSLVVYPAAGLLRYFQGDHLAIVNLSPTDADRRADLCVAAPVGQVLDAVTGEGA
ncbi:MAG: NAD-dependent protein deacylase [Eggerthellaceae bacterium]|nr:NAD-dependent protein deacylase [Eggerthellaceae bacterium]